MIQYFKLAIVLEDIMILGYKYVNNVIILAWNVKIRVQILVRIVKISFYHIDF